MFDLETTKFKDLIAIKCKKHFDSRGVFQKIFHKNAFSELGLKFDCEEQFFSTSHKNVLRGMHFQLPPKAHKKLVYVTSGSILDVVVDLRKSSESFRKYVEFEVSEDSGRMIFIPEGFAHGFFVLSDSATVVYNTTSSHEPALDSGVRWNSFGFNWPIQNPIISSRDQDFQSLDEFDSPF